VNLIKVSSNTVHNIIIGMSDGLTVPFALAAGISGTVTHNTAIIVAGISSIVAGCISMGLGGYLATQSDVEYYYSKRQDEDSEPVPKREQESIQVLSGYGLPMEEIRRVVNVLKSNPRQWIDLLLLNEFALCRPYRNEAISSGAVVGLSYLVSGFIPLAPYFCIPKPYEALLWSIVVTLVTLVVFGYAKARAVNSNPWKSILGVIAVSGIAAGAAFVTGKLIV
jgi:VIT1/CCC1 family predicted Fe2+/Mn2+ transporter